MTERAYDQVVRKKLEEKLEEILQQIRTLERTNRTALELAVGDPKLHQRSVGEDLQQQIHALAQYVTAMFSYIELIEDTPDDAHDERRELVANLREAAQKANLQMKSLTRAIRG